MAFTLGVRFLPIFPQRVTSDKAEQAELEADTTKPCASHRAGLKASLTPLQRGRHVIYCQFSMGHITNRLDHVIVVSCYRM
jgi:hypothetical protein